MIQVDTDWTQDAQYFEYTKAANPIGAGLINKVPLASFPGRLHEEGPSRIIPFDLSSQLGSNGPATSPSLCASFVRIRPDEHVETNPNATSEVYYVIRGRGRSRLGERDLRWEQGDFFALPAGSAAAHHAETDSALYWVHDEPLLRYLGANASTPRFEPTLYPRERSLAALREVEQDPVAARRSRVSVLLANRNFQQTRTITHVLWTMLGVLPERAVQLPHRHESVALDFIIDCEPGCYTLIGRDLDDEGNIRYPRRADWERGSAFVTPPGLWHAHVNESGAPAHLIPIQDAGLHTYLRTLDIRFFHEQ
ncbi:MAG TPA: cupin domain-containing protein [Baekduia sp.]|uniref:cupin domain-containing protein n=1 Tax=Baekduia sp. TaxID=2600305 RepID=UPI002BF9403A|nr:cupin domain-containing protein [Baekduia sp.]HMJ36502.1 cupin domain-containing protein [Baekduia sp.]